MQGRALLADHGSISTLLTPGDASLSITYDDPFTLPVKAVILLDRAARFAARARAAAAGSTDAPVIPAVDRAEIATLEAGLLEFIAAVTSVHETSNSIAAAASTSSVPDTIADVTHFAVDPARSHAAMKIVPIYTLTTAHGALMELYSIDAAHDPVPYGRMVNAARAIAAIVHDTEVVHAEKYGVAVGVS